MELLTNCNKYIFSDFEKIYSLILTEILNMTKSHSGAIQIKDKIKINKDIPESLFLIKTDNNFHIEMNYNNNSINNFIIITLRYYNNSLLGKIIIANTDLNYELIMNGPIINILNHLQFLVEVNDIIDTDKDKIKDIFFANISHELKTILNGIVGMTQLLADTNLSPVQKEYSNTINECSIQLLAMINDILDYTKMENKKLTLVLEPLNIRKCLEAAHDIVSIKSSEKNLDIIFDINNDVPTNIVGDVARLKQILINLLSNAIKYTEKGEIRTIVKRNSVNKLLFEVSDTGSGIDEKSLAIIFKPFMRVDDIITKTQAGTGLGLPIAKYLVELMGGEIWINSKIDIGTTVSFTVEVEGSLIDNTPSYEAIINKRILIVDDNINNRKILTTIFLKWGAHPLAVASAEEALIYINSDTYTFNIILLDICMPKMSGIELAKRIRNIKPNIPLIAISSITEIAETDMQYFNSIITKPIKNSVLLNACINAKEISRKKEPEENKDLAIMVIDDVKINRIVASDMLKRLKYVNVKIVSSGYEALDELKLKKYDIIFVDLVMNGMDGFECAKKIFDLYENPPILIALSAKNTPMVKDRCNSCGFSAFLDKPLIMKELSILLELINKKIKL